MYVHTPIITASDCEGAGEMFQVTTVLPDHHDPISKVKMFEYEGQENEEEKTEEKEVSKKQQKKQKKKDGEAVTEETQPALPEKKIIPLE